MCVCREWRFVFRPAEVQNAFLIEKCDGLAEERYTDIARLMYEQDNLFSDVLYQLPALIDFSDD